MLATVCRASFAVGHIAVSRMGNVVRAEGTLLLPGLRWLKWELQRRITMVHPACAGARGTGEWSARCEAVFAQSCADSGTPLTLIWWWKRRKKVAA